MTSIRHQCPHCLTQDVALEVVAYTEIEINRGIAHLSCPRCKGPSAAQLMARQQFSFSQLPSIKGDPVDNKQFSLISFWPAPPAPLIPEFLPPDIERVYLQAERNFPTEGNEDAAGSMYRKALDIGLKKIDPSLTGMLGQKIKKLAADGKLTPEIAEWSNVVRDLAMMPFTRKRRLRAKNLRTFGGLPKWFCAISLRFQI
jgi:hypothetical protein